MISQSLLIVVATIMSSINLEGLTLCINKSSKGLPFISIIVLPFSLDELYLASIIAAIFFLFILISELIHMQILLNLLILWHLFFIDIIIQSFIFFRSFDNLKIVHNSFSG